MPAEHSEPDLIQRARDFAIACHERIDHKRKYNQQPYAVHLKAVAQRVATVTDDPEMISAAWLHDVVEDTATTLQQVEELFGPGVAALVQDLTDVSRSGDGNRAVRKAIDRAHTAAASPRAKTVKLADLIDNCQDICKHDPRFARTYLAEMTALLAVLEEGDPRLLAQAQKAHERCRERLGLPETPPAECIAPPAPAPALPHHLQRSWRLFGEAFSARDIAEPLRSFDAESDAAAARLALDQAGIGVAGVREGGLVTGYLTRSDLDGGGRCGDLRRPLHADQRVDGDAPLSAVIEVLTRHDHCFVNAIGAIGGVIARGDMEKPVVRMWLFGIITIAEMELAAKIRERWPGEGWSSLISEGRLAKARELREERMRRGQGSELLDCLQLSDKTQIAAQDEALLRHFDLPSRSATRGIGKSLESLRNNLAHAQSIVSHDWLQIIRLARRIGS